LAITGRPGEFASFSGGNEQKPRKSRRQAISPIAHGKRSGALGQDPARDPA
jgi:hypothetical protein